MVIYVNLEARNEKGETQNLVLRSFTSVHEAIARHDEAAEAAKIYQPAYGLAGAAVIKWHVVVGFATLEEWEEPIYFE